MSSVPKVHKNVETKVQQNLLQLKNTKVGKKLVSAVDKAREEVVSKTADILNSAGSSNALERTEKSDRVYLQTSTSSRITSVTPVRKNPSVSKSRIKEAPKDTIGDAFLSGFKLFRDQLFADVQKVCQSLPGWTFVESFNRPHSIKGVNSTLDKIQRRADKYEEFGFNSAVRDYVRLTVFRPDAEKINPLTNQPHYMDFFDAMKKKGYKIAETEKEVNGKVVFDESGSPVMVPDIDVRKGDNKVPSGYGDIQSRLTKKGKLAEIIILPGMNYAVTKNFEHELFFDNFKLYENQKLPKSEGVKGIIKELRKTFANLTKQLYDDAEMRDAKGMGLGKVITFEKEDIKKIDGLFSDLKALYYARFRASNKTHVSMLSEADARKEFESSAVYIRLDNAEQRLRKVMDLYKPIKK